MDTIVQTHSLFQDEFDVLGSGYGGADTIVRLAEAQESVRRSLLARVAEAGPAQDAAFNRAWDLLVALDESRPAAVNAVLAHPYVRAWAVRCLEPSRTDTAVRDLAHLGAITASAALRAGVAAELTLPVVDSAVRLPTFGALVLGADSGSESDVATMVIRDDGFTTVAAGGAVHELWPGATAVEPTGPHWHPLRALTAEGLVVTFEDTDPYRDCHGSPADRVPHDEFLRWDAEFCAALAFIDEHLPAYAPALRAGLSTITPMARTADGTHCSAAARHAFGAIGAARPGDPAILALLLVHEFQHVKLDAVLDLFDLYDTADTEARYYAPWRPDPRPLQALLHGTYAHIAVSEFWRVKRLLPSADGAGRADGASRADTGDEAQFARWRGHTHEAVTELLASGSLTPLGERFVRAMGATVAAWLDEPVGALALDAAHLAACEHRAAFDQAVKAGR